MPKKDRKEQKPAEFRTTPFKALKGFEPAALPAAARPAPAPKKADPAEDDAELFLRAMSGVKPKGGEGPLPERVRPAQSRPVAEDRAREEQRLFLEAMATMGAKFTAPAVEEEALQPRASAGRMKQLKRGTLRIEAELDLHGYLRDEALARLGHFIADASAQGRRAVLVITGKGINSAEGPVLQGAVAAWLNTEGKKLVAEFQPAPRDKGGSGAFVVFLRSRP